MEVKISDHASYVNQNLSISFILFRLFLWIRI